MEPTNIKNFQSFLNQCHQLSDTEWEIKLERTSILLQPSPYDNKSSSATNRRYARAQKHLLDIRRQFGNAVYYLCLFASTITPLDDKSAQFDAAIREWTGKDEIPDAFTTKAQEIVQKHLAKQQSKCEAPALASPRKRHQSPPNRGDGRSNEGGNTPKRVRFGEGREVMSVGRMIEEPDIERPNIEHPANVDRSGQDECESDSSQLVAALHSQNEFNNSHQQCPPALQDSIYPGNTNFFAEPQSIPSDFQLPPVKPLGSALDAANGGAHAAGDDMAADRDSNDGGEGDNKDRAEVDNEGGLHTSGGQPPASQVSQSNLPDPLPHGHSSMHFSTQDDLRPASPYASNPQAYVLQKDDIYEVLAFYHGRVTLLMPESASWFPQITIECSYKDAFRFLEKREQIIFPR